MAENTYSICRQKIFHLNVPHNVFRFLISLLSRAMMHKILSTCLLDRKIMWGTPYMSGTTKMETKSFQNRKRNPNVLLLKFRVEICNLWEIHNKWFADRLWKKQIILYNRRIYYITQLYHVGLYCSGAERGFKLASQDMLCIFWTNLHFFLVLFIFYHVRCLNILNLGHWFHFWGQKKFEALWLLSYFGAIFWPCFTGHFISRASARRSACALF